MSEDRPNYTHDWCTKKDVEEATEQAIKRVLLEIGINAKHPSDIIEAQKDIQYLRNARLGSEKVSFWAKRSIIGAFCTGFIYLIASGLRQML